MTTMQSLLEDIALPLNTDHFRWWVPKRRVLILTCSREVPVPLYRETSYIQARLVVRDTKREVK